MLHLIATINSSGQIATLLAIATLLLYVPAAINPSLITQCSGNAHGLRETSQECNVMSTTGQC
jgi:hypothetical protein